MTVMASHVLICRTDNIGDVVLALPITAWLKQRFPTIKISFMCRAYAADIVRRCSSVDDVIEVENFLIDPPAFFAASDIDTVIFTQPDQRLAIEAFKARIPNRIGNARQKLYLRIFCNRRVYFSKRISALHEAQFNFEFLRPFGLTDIPDLTTIKSLYRFDAFADEQVRKRLAPYPFNLIIHTKSNGHGREWPMEHYSTLAKRLAANPHIHLWATGSAAEGDWLEQNAAEFLQLPNVTNVCGQFTLDQLTSFIQMADGLIASGTGPLHISAAARQRTLGLFPPIRPMHPGRWAPVGEKTHVLCKADCDGKCAGQQIATCDCMMAITPAAVEEIVGGWFAEASQKKQFIEIPSIAPRSAQNDPAPPDTLPIWRSSGNGV